MRKMRKDSRKCGLQYCDLGVEYKTFREVMACDNLDKQGRCYREGQEELYECNALFQFRKLYAELGEFFQKQTDSSIPQNSDEVGGFSGHPDLSFDLKEESDVLNEMK